MRRVVLLVALAATVFLAGAAVGHLWTRERERAPVASSPSPNGSLTAVVFRTSGEKLLFGIRGTNGTTLLMDSALPVPGGYHDPRILLRWAPNSQSVKVAVDHDFGDGNIVYVFDVRSLTLRRE